MGMVHTKYKETTPSNLVKKYYSRIGTTIFYLHTNQFKHLLSELKNYGLSLSHATRLDKVEYDIHLVDYKVRQGWELRDHQVPIGKFLTIDPHGSKLVGLQTGKGKTATSLIALAEVRYKIAVVILPTYISKWVSDICTIHDATLKDIVVIQGGLALANLIGAAKEDGNDGKYYIFSNKTLQDFITKYERDPEETEAIYGCKPIDLFPLLGVGSLLIDENHQHFHATFKILLHSNVEYHVGLSATLISDDQVVTRMHQVVFPKHRVCNGDALDKYAHVFALSYDIPSELLKYVRTSARGSNVYSHIAFEKSMLQHPKLRAIYLRHIDNTLKDFYIDAYKEGDKCVVFVGTVAFAFMLVQRYTMLFDDKEVKKYTEEDPYDNILTSDIIISTVTSAGTAVDIPELRVVVQTVSMSSSVANIQTLGRLRKLKDKDVKFCYIYADNLQKQRQHHFKRYGLYRDRVALHKNFRL